MTMSDQIFTPCTTCRTDVRHRQGSTRAYCPGCKQVVTLNLAPRQAERPQMNLAMVETVAAALYAADQRAIYEGSGGGDLLAPDLESWLRWHPWENLGSGQVRWRTLARASIGAYEAYVMSVYRERLAQAEAANV